MDDKSEPLATLLVWFWRLVIFLTRVGARVSLCESAKCARCGRRPSAWEIRSFLILYHRFDWRRAKQSRLWHSNTEYLALCHGQAPTVFAVDNLRTAEFPAYAKLEPLGERTIHELSSTIDLMRWRETERQPGLGTWRLAHLVNQGQPTENFEILPVSLKERILQLFPRECKLFNAALSQIEIRSAGASGQLIAPHCGISNVKWRHHLPIAISPQLIKNLVINVNGKRRDWSTPFTMDDSFEHGVELRNPNGDMIKGSRLVLIMDGWNENLTLSERDEIAYIASKTL